MTQANNRSLCLALGRLRFVIVTSCWLIALSLVAQIVIWSLCTFTELRGAGAESPDRVKEIGSAEKKDDKKKDAKKPPAAEAKKPDAKWRPDGTEEGEAAPAGPADRMFRILVTVSRTLGLMGAFIIGPLLALGVLLAVPAGAPRAERAINALTWAIVLVLLAMPLGGWFGMAWNQGTIMDYTSMIAEIEAAKVDGFTPRFYATFLLMPAACAAGFVMVGLHFSSAVVAVLIKRDVFDPEVEKEASNVAPTSLHGTGRQAGALAKALEADQRKKAKREQSLSRVSPGEMPKRLI
jgi:hypothetical protein